MTWYFPHVPLLLIAILIWLTRETLRTGSVEKYGIRVNRSSQPITFWAFVATWIGLIVAMTALLAMWATDYKAMRSG